MTSPVKSEFYRGARNVGVLLTAVAALNVFLDEDGSGKSIDIVANVAEPNLLFNRYKCFGESPSFLGGNLKNMKS